MTNAYILVEALPGKAIELLNSIKGLPSVKTVHLVTGPYDVIAFVETPDLKAELESRQVGGLGVFLIRRMLDDVHYSRSAGQNILSLAVRYGEK